MVSTTGWSEYKNGAAPRRLLSAFDTLEQVGKLIALSQCFTRATVANAFAVNLGEQCGILRNRAVLS